MSCTNLTVCTVCRKVMNILITVRLLRHHFKALGGVTSNGIAQCSQQGSGDTN